MEPITKNLKPLNLRIKKPGGINSPFNDAVDRAIQTLHLEGRFSYWCGRFKGIEPQMISMLASKAKEGNKPAALLNWLINDYRHPKAKNTS